MDGVQQLHHSTGSTATPANGEQHLCMCCFAALLAANVSSTPATASQSPVPHTSPPHCWPPLTHNLPALTCRWRAAEPYSFSSSCRLTRCPGRFPPRLSSFSSLVRRLVAARTAAAAAAPAPPPAALLALSALLLLLPPCTFAASLPAAVLEGTGGGCSEPPSSSESCGPSPSDPLALSLCSLLLPPLVVPLHTHHTGSIIS